MMGNVGELMEEKRAMKLTREQWQSRRVPHGFPRQFRDEVIEVDSTRSRVRPLVRMVRIGNLPNWDG
ncbi:hypothetical protein V6N12_067960 [Hibiscus sabdariffa]|uniref:Uncharacterized protein n=1 Tax=Hibiscus sabdariffa TaxID=183260 RepID=A0ABR2FPA3_9ROSI